MINKLAKTSNINPSPFSFYTGCHFADAELLANPSGNPAPLKHILERRYDSCMMNRC